MNKYTAYGYRQKEANVSAISYNGDYEIDGLFLMGNGYRLYSPSIRRFYSPDSMSPGEAGVNPYTYNLGDPINRSDPSGHLSVGQWISIGLGIAGILVSVLSLGLGAAAGAGMITLASGTFLASMAATSVTSVVVESIGLVAGAVALASEFSDNKQLKKAGEILGYVSFGLAIGPSIAKGVSKGITKAVNKALKPTIAKNGGKLAMTGRDSSKMVGAEETFTGTVKGNGSGVANSSGGASANPSDWVYQSTSFVKQYGQRLGKDTYKNGNRVIRFNKDALLEARVKVWNHVFTKIHDGQFQHFADAKIEYFMKNDGTIKRAFSTPYIEGRVGVYYVGRGTELSDMTTGESELFLSALDEGIISNPNQIASLRGWYIEQRGKYLPLGFMLPEWDYSIMLSR